MVGVLEKKAEDDGWKTKKHPGNEPGIDLKLEQNNRVVAIGAVGEREKQENGTGRIRLALG
ncbi:hypothetical protein ACFLVX_03605 [Chloroflexota bacterium]